MTLTRRQFISRTGGLVTLSALGLDSARSWTQPEGARPRPHYIVLMTLRGGFDAVLSLNPQDATLVGDDIYVGYRADERIQGPRRLFGPLIGGLERHDDDLCLIHGVRSDTTSHPDGLAMLERGRMRARSAQIATILGDTLNGDAPLRTLDLVSSDGEPLVREGQRPRWADIRAEAHRDQAWALEHADLLVAGKEKANHLGRFLDQSRHDAADLDTRFVGAMGTNLRLAFQAIRGNWARCIQVATRGLWFDSHSDNMRFQELRQPSTWADLATFIDLLKSTRNAHGRLLDQTTLAVFSEFGRFPRLNGERGKDHFPENSWLLAGRGVRGGTTVGATDRVGKSRIVHYESGALEVDDARPIFIDNTFATLVEIAGVSPTKHGYERRAVIDRVRS
jgi:uncharacterized protein (DUF1501 family)